MLRLLKSATFSGEALIRERRLLENGANSDLSLSGTALISRWRLFETWHLLEKIQYVNFLKGLPLK